jgi:hypothetical protein
VEPTLRIAPLSALLVATHLGMASTRCRAGMVSRLGENWFVALYLYATEWMEAHQ